MDYEYSKSHYRLIVLDRSRKKELDADPKAIQQIVFVKQLKDEDDVNESGVTIYVCLNPFRNNQRNKTKILSRKCNSLIKLGKF